MSITYFLPKLIIASYKGNIVKKLKNGKLDLVCDNFCWFVVFFCLWFVWDVLAK